MGITVFGIGDEIYYPDPRVRSTRTVTVLDREIKQWKSGRIFIRYLCEETMDRLVEDCHKNLENEYDNVIVIEGKEGSGKSTLAIQLAMKINPEFDLETDYIYSYDEMIEAITDKEKDDRGRVFLLDETSAIMNNRDAMTSSSKNMVELLEMMRSRGWTLIMCIPSVERLDKYLRDYRIRYLLKAVEMSWDLKRTEQSRGYYELRYKKGNSYETFHTVAYGVFEDLDPELKAKYKKIKNRSQERKMREIAGEEPKKDTKIGRAQKKLGEAMLTLADMGMSQQELADKFGYTKHSVTQMLYDARKARERESED